MDPVGEDLVEHLSDLSHVLVQVALDALEVPALFRGLLDAAVHGPVAQDPAA